MSGCRFPQHHQSARGGPGLLTVAAVIAALVLAAKVVTAVAAFVTAYLAWIIAIPCGITAVVTGYVLARAAPRSRAAWRNWPRAVWVRVRWRPVTRQLGLAKTDTHRADKIRRGKAAKPRVRHLRCWVRPDAYGLVATVRTVPGTGRAELEAAAPYLADQWRAVRVGVSQPRPAVLELRAMRRDPLAEPLGSGVLPRFDGRRVMLGRDEYGQMRYASLAGLSSSVIGGNPGRGKSQCATSFAVQLAPVPNSDWYVLDGGGGADWEPWRDRSVAFATDNLAEAREVVEDAHARMVKRLATLTADLGTRNAWSIGPSADYPLVWVPIDESSVYLDLESAKALGKEAEQQVRAIRALVKNMQQRGRKVLYHVTLMAQKATSSSVPPDLRDLAGLRLCFGVATTEAGIAVLGDDLRAYPSLSPTQLQGDEHVGVAVARLKSGADPYTRFRVPFVTEDEADAIAAAAASLRPGPSGATQSPAPEAARPPLSVVA